MCMVRDSSGWISQGVFIKITQQTLDAAQQRPLVLSVADTLHDIIGNSLATLLIPSVSLLGNAENVHRM